jgi:hypothetical protein
MKNELVRPEIQRVDEKDLEFIKMLSTGGFFHYHGKPFTGFVVWEYHENGNIWYEEEYAQGQVMGWEVNYYDNEKVATKSLMLGLTTVCLADYDYEGNVEDAYWLATKKLYNMCAELTGMDLIEVNEDYTDRRPIIGDIDWAPEPEYEK